MSDTTLSSPPLDLRAAEADRARRAGEKYVPWVLLAPTTIILTLVGFYPLVYSLYISTTAYKPTQATRYQGFVGIDNYAAGIVDGQFLHALGLTALFTLASVGISLVLAIAMSMLFSQQRPGFVLLRTIILIPMLITPIAVGIVWRTMMMPDLGVLNYLLQAVSLPPLLWTGSYETALASMILVDVWQWTPFMFIIIFAGVKALPTSPFEAAAIDGAGPMRTFFSVTLPMLKPVIVIATLLRLIDAMRTFDTIHLMTRGGPNFATDVVSVYLQRVNFRFFDLGYGAALSWMTLIVILVTVLIFVKLTGFMKLVALKEDR
ncbi:sugar ABC transporter permease [Bosea sp. 117]|uniref:carbohydrate ABC transporter permease n=1 Tax=Bosea sp. 117 TaxID=1125973 RepID=UPI0018CC6E31|nr:sugar ABC transporter permease [Bosea sp. 117]